jgi:hypothetical protein
MKEEEKLRERVRRMTRILVTKYVEEFPEGSRAILKSIMSKHAEVYDVDRLFSAYFIAEVARIESDKLSKAIEMRGGTGSSTGSSRRSMTRSLGDL